ncbi:MAG TPA: transglutaminase family protein [Tepidisphaeraceae bacterium]|jgi:transglutaminase-like putative cysteine protease
MKLRVRHTTAYVYGETVPLCHNLVHICPRDTHHQRLLEYELTIVPTPVAVRTGEDYFGNSVAWFSLQEPHRELSITAVSLVDIAKGVSGTPLSDAWESAVHSEATTADAEARAYAFESPYIPISPKLADYARPSFSPNRPLAEAAVDLMRRIHREFKFVSGVTAVGTPVLDVLRDRRGVCQDFSHLMVGCLRSLGLAARYVSGYLLTRPPPGKPRLVGCDASHAWVSLWVPGYGWLDLDPTNDCIPGESHVTVGWARDYGDIGPVRGVIVGGHRHSLKVSVDVEPIEEKAAARA